MNQIELITKYSVDAWDTVYKQESMSSLLDTNKEYVKFTGAKTVKIAKWQNGGLKDYYRNNIVTDGSNGVDTTPGYQKSQARLVWEEFMLRADRAAAFPIEKFDNEESGNQIVGLGVKEISRTTIVPEVDAYTFSTIASYCTENLGNLVNEDVSEKPLTALNRAFTYFANNEVPVRDQIVFASPDFMNALRNSNEVTKFLGQTDYTRTDITFQITKYQGRDIVEVSPERLRTNINLFGQEGYSWGEGSKLINFLMVAKSAVIHVVKYNIIKIIGDDLNLAGQGFDGYTIFARVYYDTFVPDNKRVALYCSVANGEGDTSAMKLDVLVSNGKIKSITTLPGEKLAFVVTSSLADEKVGNKMSGTHTLVHVGDAVTVATKFYAIDSDKKVLAKFEYTLDK